MPAEWRRLPLGEVLTLQRGFDLPIQDRRDGQYPVVSSSGVTGHHDEAKVSGPGVVTGRYGTIGQVFFVEGDFWPLNTTLYVRDFKGNDPRYLGFLLETLDFRSMNNKSTIPGVNRNDLHRIEVALPSLDEQRRIGELLGALDERVASNRQLVAQLEALVPAAFSRQFPSFADNATTDLSDLVTVTAGVSYSSADLQPGTCAMVTLKSVKRGGGYSTDGLKPYVGPFKPEQRLQSGDLVMARTDLTQAAEVVGRPAIVRPTTAFSTLVASLDLAIMRPRDGRVTIPFLYGLFSTPEWVSHARGFANGTTVLHLRTAAFTSFRIALPPQNMVRQFSDDLAECLELVVVLSREIDMLTEVRASVARALVAGDITLPTMVEAPMTVQ